MRSVSCAGSIVQKTWSVLCAAGLLVSTTFAQSTPAGPLPSAPAGSQQSPPQTIAQQAQTAAQPQPVTYQGPFHIELPHSHNPLASYRPSTVPELNLQNSPRLYDLIRDGKLRISLQDAIALALENNLVLASFRYNFSHRASRSSAHQGGRQCQRRQYRRGPDHAERLWRLRGRGWLLELLECGRRRRRYRHLHSRRRRGRSLVRPLPQLLRLCATHRHPGAERCHGRHRTL